METQYYYRSIDGTENNIAVKDRYLQVNCAGSLVLPHQFVAQTSRKDYYLQYLVGGHMKVWIDGTIQDMRPGEFLIYYPDTEYHYTNAGKKEVRYYWAHFSGYYVPALLQNCQIFNKTLIEVGIRERLLTHFEELFREFLLRDTCFDDSAASKLSSLLIDFSRSRVSQPESKYLLGKKLFLSVEYIHKHFDEDIRVEQLADLEHLSVSRYRTLFHEATGLSPLEYLISLRIRRACELLTQTNLSIREVGETVGYTDSLYFSRIFKKRTGQSPSGYQKQAP